MPTHWKQLYMVATNWWKTPTVLVIFLNKCSFKDATETGLYNCDKLPFDHLRPDQQALCDILGANDLVAFTLISFPDTTRSNGRVD
jgi:hypothetical protein